MKHLLGLIGVVAVVAQLITGSVSRWVPILSLVIGVPPMVLAGARVVSNAMRLGRRTDPIDVQSALARRICRDHLFCLAAIAGFLLVQLVAAVGVLLPATGDRPGVAGTDGGQFGVGEGCAALGAGGVRGVVGQQQGIHHRLGPGLTRRVGVVDRA